MKVSLAFLFTVILLSSCGRYEQSVKAVQASVHTSHADDVLPATESSQTLPSWSLEKDKYIEWIRDANNGLHREEEIDGLIFSIFYKPLDYVVLHELISSSISLDSFRHYRHQYEGAQYVTLTIRSKESEDILKHGISSEREYYNRIDYCSFGMQHDLQLVEGSDTLACTVYHYERTYQVAPYTHFVLAFANSKDAGGGKLLHKKDKTLVFHDNAFGKGIVKLKLKADDLYKIPNLLIK